MPHLFLHFDVNETILVGDVAGGDTPEDCLNKIIAKSAFVSTKDVVPVDRGSRTRRRRRRGEDVADDDDEGGEDGISCPLAGGTACR